MRPLERYELFHSNDLDEVRDAVGRVFVPHRLDLAGKSNRLDARMHSRRFTAVAANYVSYGAEVSIEPGELGSFFVVQVPLSGRSHVRCGRDEVFSTSRKVSVVSPTEPLSMRWSADCEELILRLDRPAVEAHLSQLLDAPLPQPVVFRPGMDVSAGTGRSWLRLLHAFIEDVDNIDDSLAGHRLGAAGYEDVLIKSLLIAQPHNYTEKLVDLSQPVVPSRSVNVALDLIETHPEWDHTGPSMASAAGVSLRALQKGFAQHLGVGPKEYLTNVRMERARSELCAKDRDTITVRQVASHWRLGHPGRFANEYHRRFGELPSETLGK